MTGEEVANYCLDTTQAAHQAFERILYIYKTENTSIKRTCASCEALPSRGQLLVTSTGHRIYSFDCSVYVTRHKDGTSYNCDFYDFKLKTFEIFFFFNELASLQSFQLQNLSLFAYSTGRVLPFAGFVFKKANYR